MNLHVTMNLPVKHAKVVAVETSITTHTCESVNRKRSIEPMLIKCWAETVDRGPTLNQHRHKLWRDSV